MDFLFSYLQLLPLINNNNQLQEKIAAFHIYERREKEDKMEMISGSEQVLGPGKPVFEPKYRPNRPLFQFDVHLGLRRTV